MRPQVITNALSGAAASTNTGLVANASTAKQASSIPRRSVCSCGWDALASAAIGQLLNRAGRIAPPTMSKTIINEITRNTITRQSRRWDFFLAIQERLSFAPVLQLQHRATGL